jgi:integrase
MDTKPNPLYLASRQQYYFKVKSPNGGWLTKYIPKSEAASQAEAELYIERYISSNQFKAKVVPTNDEIKKTTIRYTPRTLKSLFFAALKLRLDNKNITHSYFVSVTKSFDLFLPPRRDTGHKSTLPPVYDISDFTIYGELTIPHQRAFINSLLARNLKPSYVKTICTCIRQFYIWAAVEFSDMSKPIPIPFDAHFQQLVMPKTVKRDKAILTEEQFVKLLSHPFVRPNLRLKYTLHLYTGMRAMEVAGLTFGDIKVKAGIPYIDLKYQLHKGGFPGAAIHIPPKHNSSRIIPIHKTLAIAIDYWRNVGFELFLGRKPTDADPLVPNDEGKFFAWETGSVKLGPVFRAAGIPLICPETNERLTLHSLRRSFASLIARQTHDRNAISILLGHTIPGVTSTHYIIEDSLRLHNIIALLPEVNQRSYHNFPGLSKAGIVCNHGDLHDSTKLLATGGK